MTSAVKHTLDTMISNWNAMSGSENDDAEASANEFETSFYIFIESVREWVNELDQQPKTLEEFFELSMIQEIVELLPVPLQLNFETEAEFILDNKIRIDDEKYD